MKVPAWLGDEVSEVPSRDQRFYEPPVTVTIFATLCGWANAKPSLTTTLDTYWHLWPDADESTRIAIGTVIVERMKTTAYQLRTEGM